MPQGIQPQAPAPFSLGNVLRDVEAIKGARTNKALAQRELDPNSLNNQMRQAQINTLNYKAQNPAGVASYNKNPIFVRAPAPGGGFEIKAFQLNDQGTDPKEVVFPDGAMPAIKGQWIDRGDGIQFFQPYGDMQGGGMTDFGAPVANGFTATPPGQPGAGQQSTAAPAGFVPKGIAPQNTPEHLAAAAAAKTVAEQNAKMGLDPTGKPIAGVATASEAAGSQTRAQEQAKQDVERTSPQEVKKQQMREADAVNAKVLIDGMLAPRKDGKGIYASYAYGKSNVMAPELMKTQNMIDAEAKRNQLVSMMQLENVAKLKGTGPITEPEQKVLRQAMTVLENPLISDELVERELKRVRVMFARWEREAKDMQVKDSPAVEDDDPLGLFK